MGARETAPPFSFVGSMGQVGSLGAVRRGSGRPAAPFALAAQRPGSGIVVVRSSSKLCDAGRTRLPGNPLRVRTRGDPQPHAGFPPFASFFELTQPRREQSDDRTPPIPPPCHGCKSHRTRPSRTRSSRTRSSRTRSSRTRSSRTCSSRTCSSRTRSSYLARIAATMAMRPVRMMPAVQRNPLSSL